MSYKIIVLILCLFIVTNNAKSQNYGTIDTNCDAEEGRFPSVELIVFLIENSFMIDSVHVIKDEEYKILPSSPFLNSDLNAIVKMGHEEMDLKDLPKQFDGMEIKLYQYKHPRDCGSFSQLFSDFMKSEKSIFTVFVNIDEKKGFLAYKISEFK
jgi:regulatory protein YycI of two-component signal transduction system YycFG